MPLSHAIKVAPSIKKYVKDREFDQKKHKLCTNCQKKSVLELGQKKHFTFVDFFSLLSNLGLTGHINTP